MPGGGGRELHSRVELELLEDVAEVGAHRVRGDQQPLGHLTVGHALDHEAYHRQLGVG